MKTGARSKAPRARRFTSRVQRAVFASFVPREEKARAAGEATARARPLTTASVIAAFVVNGEERTGFTIVLAFRSESTNQHERNPSGRQIRNVSQVDGNRNGFDCRHRNYGRPCETLGSDRSDRHEKPTSRRAAGSPSGTDSSVGNIQKEMQHHAVASSRRSERSGLAANDCIAASIASTRAVKLSTSCANSATVAPRGSAGLVFSDSLTAPPAAPLLVPVSAPPIPARSDASHLGASPDGTPARQSPAQSGRNAQVNEALCQQQAGTNTRSRLPAALPTR